MNPEAINAWRVFPRIAFLIFLAMMWNTNEWFQSLQDPSNAQSAYASALLAAAAAWFKFYVESGNGKRNTDTD